MSSNGLPTGWTMATFGDAVDSMSNGIGGKQNKEGAGIPVSRIETIAAESIDWDRVGYLAEFDAKRIERYLLSEGDILFSHINSPSHLGKTAIVSGPKQLYHGINLLRVIVDRKIIYPELFDYYCRFARALGVFSMRAQHAVNQSSLNQKKLAAIDIPIPPLAEQKQIVAKLDELLAQVDTIKVRLDAIPAILKRFRQSVLAAAVSGRLTEDFRTARGLGPWVTTTFGELVESSGNGISKRRGESGVMMTVLRLADFKDAYRICGNERSIRLTNAEAEKYALRNGDLLAIRVNGSADLAGKFIHYQEGRGEAYCDHFIRFRVNRRLLEPRFFTFVANEGEGRRQLRESLSTSAGQNTINQKSIKVLSFELPPAEEQTEIVRRVDQLFAFADQIEQRLKTAQARIDHLTQSILAKAFRGELTAEWREQNPELISGENSAEALLARIKAERETGTQKERRTRKRATA